MTTQGPYDASYLNKHKCFQLMLSQMAATYSKVKCCVIRSFLLEGDSSYSI